MHDPTSDSARFEARLARQELELAGLREAVTRRSRRWPRPRVGRRAASVLAVVALFITAPLALATDRFVDVPPEPFHHDDITSLSNAGITAGCGTDSVTGSPIYCPNIPVTRAQMASFLVRGLGRGGAAHVSVGPVQNEWLVASEVTITVPGAVTSTVPASGFVLVVASVVPEVATAGCPCQIFIDLADPETGLFSWASSEVVTDAEWAASMAATYLFPVTDLPGTVRSFYVSAVQDTGTGEVNLFVDVTAVWVPFGSAAEILTGEDAIQDGVPPR